MTTEKYTDRNKPQRWKSPSVTTTSTSGRSSTSTTSTTTMTTTTAAAVVAVVFVFIVCAMTVTDAASVGSRSGFMSASGNHHNHHGTPRPAIHRTRTSRNGGSSNHSGSGSTNGSNHVGKGHSGSSGGASNHNYTIARPNDCRLDSVYQDCYTCGRMTDDRQIYISCCMRDEGIVNFCLRMLS